MAWKNFVGPLAVAPRRRVVATALMYGLSLTVRFTSAAGEEVEIPPQSAQSTNPITSIMMNGGAQILHKDWPPAALHRGWQIGAKGCRTACEGSTPMPSLSNCAAP